MEQPVRFTPEENILIQDTRFFETKVSVSQKVKTLLKQIHIELKQEIPTNGLITPQGFDSKNFQLVKGEHLLNFPYLYLDFPKHFKNKEMMTFRTLFWWGHFFVFSWFLEGQCLNQYRRNLLEHYELFSNQGLFILMTEKPWEWRLESKYLLEIRKENKQEVAAALETQTFLKIHRYLNFDQTAVREGKVVEEALKAFRLMRPLIEA